MIQIEDNIPMIDIIGYKTDYWREVVKTIKIGQSVKTIMTEHQAAISRVCLDRLLKKEKLLYKFKFKRIEEGYRIWRIK